eukprot:GCRY01003071.1.p1 GENE.GCRY01003071.1~~GCRY01003071.1.p1  ORF type:complete len:294 (+),score=64.65 GCRY01003071.1:229-1110(+)
MAEEYESYVQKMGFKNISWKQRWLSLENCSFAYYPSREAKMSGKNAKGSFTLTPRSTVRVVLGGRDYCKPNSRKGKLEQKHLIPEAEFVIELGDCYCTRDLKERTFYLALESEDLLDRWLSVLKKNLQHVQNSPEGKLQSVEVRLRPFFLPHLSNHRINAFLADCEKNLAKTEQLIALLNELKDGQGEELSAMESAGVDVNSLPGVVGSLALCVSVRAKNPFTTSFLLGGPAFDAIDDGDELGNTALHYAAAGGDRTIVQMILGAGAEAQQQNHDGKTPADMAPSPEIATLFA